MNQSGIVVLTLRFEAMNGIFTTDNRLRIMCRARDPETGIFP